MGWGSTSSGLEQASIGFDLPLEFLIDLRTKPRLLLVRYDLLKRRCLGTTLGHDQRVQLVGKGDYAGTESTFHEITCLCLPPRLLETASSRVDANGQKRALGSRCALHRNAYHVGTHHRDLAVALPQIAVKRQTRPASQTKTAPVRWSLDHMSELVIKLRHSLQFILCGVIHCVIGIPTLTGIGCGGCRSGSCGARGRSRGAVWNGSSCRGIRRCGCC
jgi:hypothetical protein